MFAFATTSKSLEFSRLFVDETSLGGESSTETAASQFSLRHLLVWTTALAPLLLLLQMLDYAFMRRLYWRQWSVLLADAALLALVAFWAALCKGRTWSKVIWVCADRSGDGLRLSSSKSVSELFRVGSPAVYRAFMSGKASRTPSRSLMPEQPGWRVPSCRDFC